jgi:hypothetical protein
MNPTGMDQMIQDLNELCSRDNFIRFAIDKVQCSRAIYHLLVFDGAEVTAALLSRIA